MKVTLEPVTAGLDLICRGLHPVCQDDHMALSQGQLIYDALYAELASEPERQSPNLYTLEYASGTAP